MENAGGKSVLVIGGTGYLGAKVVDALLNKGANVSALVREGSEVRNLQAKGVRIVTGDITRPETTVPALSGIDVVISTAIGYSERKKGDSLKAVDDLGNRNLVDAMKQANTAKFVFTSILTADKAVNVPHFLQKKLTEDYMDQAGLSYIALRPGAFLDQKPAYDRMGKELKNGKMKVPGSFSAKWSYILTDDLAGYLATAVLNPGIPCGKIDIGMDEPLSAEMIVNFASEFTGRKIELASMPWMMIGTAMSIVGIFKPAVSDLKKMIDYFYSGLYIADTTLQRKYFGQVPSAKDSLYRYFTKIGLK